MFDITREAHQSLAESDFALSAVTATLEACLIGTPLSLPISPRNSITRLPKKARQARVCIDDLVRLVALVRDDLLDLAVVVEDHARLGALEIDRATLPALGHEQTIQLVEHLQLRQQLADLPARRNFLRGWPRPPRCRSDAHARTSRPDRSDSA